MRRSRCWMLAASRDHYAVPAGAFPHLFIHMRHCDNAAAVAAVKHRRRAGVADRSELCVHGVCSVCKALKIICKARKAVGIYTCEIRVCYGIGKNSCVGIVKALCQQECPAKLDLLFKAKVHIRSLKPRCSRLQRRLHFYPQTCFCPSSETCHSYRQRPRHG